MSALLSLASCVSGLSAGGTRKEDEVGTESVQKEGQGGWRKRVGAGESKEVKKSKGS